RRGRDDARRGDRPLQNRRHDKRNARGGASYRSRWRAASDDLFGKVARPDSDARITRTMKLLHIHSSITGANSASRQLSAALVAALKAAIPGLEVIRRDLDANPIPHLDSKRLPTVRPANAPAGAVGIADEGGSDVLGEFLGADILVIGAPMYNFGIPSQLKAWIDRIAIAGKTFSYTADG